MVDPEAIGALADLLAQIEKSELLILGESFSLKELCANLNLSQLIGEPIRSNLKALVDLILSNRKENISACGVFTLGFSDHCCLYMQL